MDCRSDGSRADDQRPMCGRRSKSGSYAGDGARKLNFFFLQPFVNYNVQKAKGFAFAYSQFITANWEAGIGQRCTFPVGG